MVLSASLSVVSGPVPVVVTVLGVVGFLWLIFYPSVRYLLIVVPISIAVAVGGTLLAHYLVEDVWRPFPEAIETGVYISSCVAALALILGVARFVAGHGWLQKLITVLAGLFAVLMALSQINVTFAYYPTVDALLGDSGARSVTLEELDDDSLIVVPIDKWRAPQNIPSGGRILTAPIPGTKSGFTARPAKIYLPPAALTSPTPRLPVLVLLAGQPGAPDDWLLGGQLVATMDAYAAEHNGLGPIVVVADGTGSTMANPICVDSKLGNVATYLSQDVPDWVAANLKLANTDSRSWAVGGLSYGGTCALQLATNHPDVYPTFLDLSGQIEPSLGTRQQTIATAFNGDEAAFKAVNPMDLMATRQYPDTAGAFVVGRDDAMYRAGLKEVFESARRAGMDVHFSEVPGGHSFAVWSVGLRQEMPWLGKRLGIPE